MPQWSGFASGIGKPRRRGHGVQFSLFLSCYYPDTSYPAARLYADMLEQATLAEQLGFTGLTVPAYHFINTLMNPGPLLLADRQSVV